MKKLILIFTIALIFSSCSDDNKSDQQQKIKLKQDTIEYVEKYCPECNGVGKVKKSLGENIVFSVITLGNGALLWDDLKTCNTCKGTGVIKIRKLNN